MTQDKWTRPWRFVAAVAMAFSLFATTLAAVAVWSTPAEEPVARGYQTKCYHTDGGDKWVCVDGGEIELQTGATLDIQSSATADFGGGVTAVALNVNTLVVTTTSDLRGNVSSGIGDLQINDGVLVTGTFDASGAVDFASTLNVDGNVDFNADLDLDGELSSGTGDLQIADDVYITGTFNTTGDATFGADVTVTDDLDITDDLTVGGDLYVTGHSWITTTTTITGDTSIVGSLDVSEKVTVVGTLDVTGDADFNADVDLDGELSSGTSDLQINDDVWITGTLDVTGIAQFDSTVDIDGNITSGTGAVTIADTSSFGGYVMYLDADFDTMMQASLDDVITMTLGAAAGRVDIATGNLKVGDGNPSLTLNGEDAYVEGTLEADGAARLDGGVTIVGDTTISSGLFLPSFADLVVSDGDWLTPTVSAYALEPASALTITLGACSNNGQPLWITVDTAYDLRFNTTNVRSSDGDVITINQYDMLSFMCQDTEWLLCFESNNQ